MIDLLKFRRYSMDGLPLRCVLHTGGILFAQHGRFLMGESPKCA